MKRRLFFKSIGYLFLSLFFLAQNSFAQSVRPFKPNSIKILFLLDVSGSMKDKWNGRERITVAKEALLDIADSLERKYPDLYIGLRVFGADYPRAQKNCTDSRLAVSFTQNPKAKLTKALAEISPKGMTPIAYSLEQAAKDFAIDSGSIHSIILITDGDENCDGDPCSVSSLLMKRKISFRPFVIGLGVEKKLENKFNCIGEFVNTTDQQSLKETMQIIIRQSMNVTSAQINLIDRNGQPTITNIPFTLYDVETGVAEYNFIHTIHPSGFSDTLFLNPLGIYKLVVHSTPPVVKDSIELRIGTHNIIALDMPIGRLYTPCNGSSFATNEAQLVLRNSKGKILNVQDLNQRENYLADNYTTNVLTQPFYRTSVSIKADKETEQKVLLFGSAIFYAAKKVNATILYEQEGVWRKLTELILDKKFEAVKMQPGNYRLVYMPVGSIDSKEVKTYFFTIDEGRNLSISLD